MIGYIFRTTNKKTGDTYLGKRYAVSFDKNYLGDMDDLAVDIEKYGRPSFEVKMILPYETKEQLDAAFEAMDEPAKKVVVKEEVKEEEEVKPAPRKRRSKAVVEE